MANRRSWGRINTTVSNPNGSPELAQFAALTGIEGFKRTNADGGDHENWVGKRNLTCPT